MISGLSALHVQSRQTCWAEVLSADLNYHDDHAESGKFIYFEMCIGNWPALSMDQKFHRLGDFQFLGVIVQLDGAG